MLLEAASLDSKAIFSAVCYTVPILLDELTACLACFVYVAAVSSPPTITDLPSHVSSLADSSEMSHKFNFNYVGFFQLLLNATATATKN